MAESPFIRHAFELDSDGGEPIPAILQLPRTTGHVPGVVLLHGFSSRKERMADSIGRTLLRRGIASVAIDLPLHGTRDGGLESLSLRNPLDVVQKWRLAVREARAAVRYLSTQSAIDPRRLGIAGYSLGAYLALIVASDDQLLRTVALAAGGDLPEATPFAALVRTFADPRKAVRGLAGRPLLMVNGRHDRTIQPAQARALFEAAGEPKELRWYEGGHWPPPDAIETFANWLADQLGESGNQSTRAAKMSSHGAQ
jgi:dienelactone hydrolase